MITIVIFSKPIHITLVLEKHIFRIRRNKKHRHRIFISKQRTIQFISISISILMNLRLSLSKKSNLKSWYDKDSKRY